MKVLLAIVLAIFVAGMLIAGCVALINDEDSLGRTYNEQAVSLMVPASHERDRCYEDECYDERGDGGDQSYDGQWSNEDRNRNRNRNRGAFSPGPFDRSPVDAFNRICMPGATCYYGDQPPEENQR